jgi:DNA-binding protein HU-beta
MAVGKTELIDRVAKTTGRSKTEVSQTLDAILDEVQKALTQRESVTLRGFGTFTAREHAARTGRNPRTGEQIAIPARTAVSFRASKPSGR